jgi:hypothetical protein
LAAAATRSISSSSSSYLIGKNMQEERKERKVQRGPQLEEIGTEGDKCFLYGTQILEKH